MDAVKKKVIVIYCYYSDDILLSLSILLWLLLLINRCALLCYSLPMFHDDWPLGQWWFAIAIYVKWPKGMYIYIYGRSSIYRWFHRDSMGFPDKRLTQRKKKKKKRFWGSPKLDRKVTMWLSSSQQFAVGETRLPSGNLLHSYWKWYLYSWFTY